MARWKIWVKNMETKQELRKRMKKIRNAISAEDREKKSTAICRKLLEMKRYGETEKILVYAAAHSEVNLDLFVERALSDGKELYFPKVYGKEMEFYRITSMNELILGAFSIREPDTERFSLSCFTGEGDGAWMLVPGVAFSPEGKRMGYGGGYYDRYLAKHTKLHRTGIAFLEQLTDEIVEEPYDYRMEDMVTDSVCDFCGK